MVFSLVRLGMLDDPRVQRGLDWLRSNDSDLTYEVSLKIQALAAAKDGKTDIGRVASLVRILETTPGQAPPFLDVEVQRKLERFAQYQMDQRRRADAVEQLAKSAYVWNPDLERAEAERAAREAEALAEQP